MNFLADESCAGPVIQALRGAGHDVTAIGNDPIGGAVDGRFEDQGGPSFRAFYERMGLVFC